MTEAPSLIVLFGVPGAGKSAAAKIFEKFGYFHYESDDDYSDEMKQASAKGLVKTLEMRDAWMPYFLQRTREFLDSYSKVAVTQAFVNDKYRVMFRDRFPEAKFLLIEAEKSVLEKRVKQRKHSLSPELSLKYVALFEPVSIPFETIKNNGTFEELEEAVRFFLQRNQEKW